jgi:hypothetical protein
MLIMDGSPLEVVNAQGGPHFSDETGSPFAMVDCRIAGPLAWKLLKEDGVPADDIDSLSISLHGLSDAVRAELVEEPNLRGITTGATYDSRERHIAVYARNIAALGLPQQLMSTQETVRLVDKTIRLALGRFAHEIHSREEEQGVQEIMIGRTQKTKVPSYILSPDERMLRVGLHEYLWPALVWYPLSYLALFAASNLNVQRRYKQSVLGSVTGAERCAAAFEEQTRTLPVVTYNPTGSITLIG